jgi:hypothetical protein
VNVASPQCHHRFSSQPLDRHIRHRPQKSSRSWGQVSNFCPCDCTRLRRLGPATSWRVNVMVVGKVVTAAGARVKHRPRWSVNWKKMLYRRQRKGSCGEQKSPPSSRRSIGGPFPSPSPATKGPTHNSPPHWPTSAAAMRNGISSCLCIFFPASATRAAPSESRWHAQDVQLPVLCARETSRLSVFFLIPTSLGLRGKGGWGPWMSKSRRDALRRSFARRGSVPT